jgi:CheY-like chemotaxis protein
VRLVKEEEQNVFIEFAVTDTGIGIAESKISSIFENFQQASSGTSRLFGGTGLGLAIVKQLVEPQGGSVTVKSEMDKGSTFSFTLPFQKTNAKATLDLEVIELDSEKTNLKVLVVEDIPLNQLLMKTLLDDFGFERDIAENGRIAVEKLQKESYDIVLMDLQMPEMNGFEATEYIRNTMNSEIPIIALTADVTTVDLEKCKAVGMNDYIAKPVDEKLLYTKILHLVKNTTPIVTELESENPKTKINKEIKEGKMQCTNLEYLKIRTKSNPKLMMEMIAIYLEQTPPLLSAMKESFENKDRKSLNAAVHKIIPSFSIIGISPVYENMAREIQDYSKITEDTEGIGEMVLQIEAICKQACEELKIEFNTIKNTKS